MSDPFAPGSDLHACAALVERGDPDRFAAAMAAPVAARVALFPLYAFNVEVSRAPWVTQEAMIAEMRLQWWRDALEEIADQRCNPGAVRRHEVITPLARILSPDHARQLDRGVGIWRWDIYRDAFEDEPHLEAYIDQTAGDLMWVAVQLLGGGKEAPVRALARASGLAAFLRAVPELEARGRVPLIDGRPAAVAALAQSALDGLRGFAPRHVSRPARAALIPAFEARFVLRQVVADPGRVKEGQLGLSPLRRNWALWRASTGRL